MILNLLGNKPKKDLDTIEPYAARAFADFAAKLKPSEIQTINKFLKHVKLDNMADFQADSSCLNYRLECLNNRLRILPIL